MLPDNNTHTHTMKAKVTAVQWSLPLVVEASPQPAKPAIKLSKPKAAKVEAPLDLFQWAVDNGQRRRVVATDVPHASASLVEAICKLTGRTEADVIDGLERDLQDAIEFWNEVDEVQDEESAPF